MKLDLILENVKNKYTMGLLEESSSEKETLQGKIILHEATMSIRNMLIEENVMQQVKDNLEEAWTAQMIEESAYDTYFAAELKKGGYKDVASIPKDLKKKFFDKVDAGWNTSSEAGKDGKKSFSK